MTARRVRQIVKIDADKCTGCGQCVPACAEGAIQVIDGKARLVSEIYCDGLGACLGHCPEGAITVEERPADEFNEADARAHAAAAKSPQSPPVCPSVSPRMFGAQQPGCPSARPMALQAQDDTAAPAEDTPSQLSSWPVQLALVPPTAPMFQDADLLITADCVPFAYPDFHRKLLKGRTVVIGCPKLDAVEPYLEKLVEIITNNEIRSVTVAHMEVPCCFGLLRLVETALGRSGKDLPLYDTTISIRGERSDVVRGIGAA